MSSYCVLSDSHINDLLDGEEFSHGKLMIKFCERHTIYDKCSTLYSPNVKSFITDEKRVFKRRYGELNDGIIIIFSI